MILANLRRLGTVHLFPTTLRGELGTELQVEVSACGDRDEDPQSVGIMLRDVGRRVTPVMNETTLGTALGPLARQIGTTPMRKLVGDAVELMETHFIRSALELTGGNRTAAAELLGLSRQSLYAKLGRYGFDANTQADSRQPDACAPRSRAAPNCSNT